MRRFKPTRCFRSSVCQRNGKPLHGHKLNRRDLRRVPKKAGLPHIRFHDLRHNYATHLLRQGENPNVVQERGHSSASFTLAAGRACPVALMLHGAFV